MSTSCISASVVGKRGRLFEHLKRKKTTSSSDVRLAKNCANASLTSRKKTVFRALPWSAAAVFLGRFFSVSLFPPFLVLYFFYCSTHVMMLTRIRAACCCVFFLYDDSSSVLKKRGRRMKKKPKNKRQMNKIICQ